jgi:hydrogenase maturation protease
MGDDGAGAAALSALEAGWVLPVDVICLDLGTPGPYLAECIRGFEAVILFDSVSGTGAPGEVRHFRYDKEHAPPVVQRLTPHTPGIGEALATLAFEGTAPSSVTVIGVIPEHVSAGTEMTEAVNRAIPMMASIAVIELEALGFSVPRSAEPRALALWWARTTVPTAC